MMIFQYIIQILVDPTSKTPSCFVQVPSIGRSYWETTSTSLPGRTKVESYQVFGTGYRDMVPLAMTRITQVWVLTDIVCFMVLSSLMTKFILKIMWLFIPWEEPIYLMNLVFWCIWMCSRAWYGAQMPKSESSNYGIEGQDQNKTITDQRPSK